MIETIKPSLHLARVYELLVETYGEPHNEPDYDPLGGLVGTILSQHTSDINSVRAYNQLITRFPTWEEVRDADTDAVAREIKSGGLANVKAPRIQMALDVLTEQQQEQGGKKGLGEYLYDELKRRTPEEGWRYLQRIPGVGPKTAACVLMFNLDLPIIAIDTHVHRVSSRLGLIGPKVNADRAHVVFAKMTPAEWVYPLHVNLIRHGREVCHAQRPACERCTLYGECGYVGNVNPRESAISNL
jgi:endonuclease-3